MTSKSGKHIIFKSVFGRDSSGPILAACLNSIPGVTGEEPIRDIEILNPFRYGEKLKDRVGILDIAAKDSTGRLYHIETQADHDRMFVQRVSWYHARIHGEQLSQGDDFSLLRKTTSVLVTVQALFPDGERVHSRFGSREWDDGFVLNDLRELHFLELPKFHGDDVKRLSCSLDRWLHLLKFGVKYATIEVEVPAELLSEEGMEMALNAYRKSLADREVLNMLHFREKAELMEATKLALAREEGRAEVAARMKELGLDRELIKKATGLSDKELDSLTTE
ncbi:MAG: Rpn family recombination-promoting nuclease/putative transposase [Candidatus Eremiobacteraeota bacterium]|nr:Rpn family recombination-promoting nuclease/putative transposase [Candidatus Eremiobacteraeota bacterium]